MVQPDSKKFSTVAFFLWLSMLSCNGPVNKGNYAYVNPFIGTSNSDRPSLWESNGGTYPGAAIPFGMVQATPDNYKYDIAEIRSFSLLNHTSGYPKGSAGNFHIMPFAGEFKGLDDLACSYRHESEEATPGYYSVLLENSGITAEMTVTRRNAILRFSATGIAKKGVALFGVDSLKVRNDQTITGRCAGHYFAMAFSSKTRNIVQEDNMMVVEISDADKDAFMVKVGFSTTSAEQAVFNQHAEIPDWDFSQTRQEAVKLWDKYLNVIEIEGGEQKDKEIFFTALYHSLLDPHLISDFGEEDRYSFLSPWDSYHTKQPLITLLYPDVQTNMLRSVLDVFDRAGRMDPGPMTGAHNVPIILDSFKKGIQINTEKAYRAMQASLMEKPYARKDIGLFLEHGFVPAEASYSVTKTLEYAYDYWAMSEMAKELDKEDYDLLLQRSLAYTAVYNPSANFMTARREHGEWTAGGYREGDKWAYNWSVTHDIQGLINLAGGVEAFTGQLEDCFQDGHYFHDNEPPMHNPYLFAYARMPWKTQKWVRKILQTEYSNTPGGLPGNDDLGALSAWYVFSSMGFYPVCPGRAEYVLASPLFRKVTLHLPNNKKFSIESIPAGETMLYSRSMTFNGKPYTKLFIEHSDIVEGGHMVFEMDSMPVMEKVVEAHELPASVTTTEPQIRLESWQIDRDSVEADEAFDVMVTCTNVSQVAGTKDIEVLVNGQHSSDHSVLLKPGQSLHKRISMQLYAPGLHNISVDELEAKMVYVKPGTPATFEYGAPEFPLPPIVSVDDSAVFAISIKNVGSYTGRESVQLWIDGKPGRSQEVEIEPGRTKRMSFVRKFESPSLHYIKIGPSKSEPFLVYGEKIPMSSAPVESPTPIVQLNFNRNTKTLEPSADYIIHGSVQFVEGIFGTAIRTSAVENTYVEIPAKKEHKQIDRGTVCTMMCWVYPMEETNFSDILSRGDINVIQVRASNTEVNYYSGGWQRGEAYTLLPENWNRKWHHVAGVSDKDQLRLYLDGKMVSRKEIEDFHGGWGTMDAPWNIGRNAHNTDRSFNGYIDEVKLFDRALEDDEVRFHMLNVAM